MDLISQFKAEKKEEKSKYTKAVRYSNGITDIINQTVDFYTIYLNKIKSFLQNNLTNQSAQIFDEIGENPVAPGLNAKDNHQYQNFYNTINVFNKSLYLTSNLLEKDVIQQLKAINDDFQQIFQNICENIDSNKILWKQKIAEFQQISTDLCDLKKRAEELHISYQNNQNEALLLCIKETCEEFRKKKAEYHKSYQQLYTSHQNYISAIQDSTLKLKVSEISRGTQLKGIIFTLQRPIDECSDSFNDIIKSIAQQSANWKEDFVTFASKNGIVRQSFAPRNYEQYQFSFTDSRLTPPPPHRETSKTYPYAFAVVLEDYNCGDELLLKKDERVFIFDALHSDLSYIQTKEGKRCFVKSSVLQEINKEYKLVICPYIAKDEKEITAPAGSVVAICSSEGEENLYENIEGKIGIIPEDYLLSDK